MLTLCGEVDMSLPEFDVVSPSFYAKPAETLEQLWATGHHV
jgi:hypothetical protein